MLEQRVGVSVVIFDASRGILLGIRRGGFGAGQYGLPGGKLENEENESLLAGSMREVLEEAGLGIKVKDLTHLGVVQEQREESNYIHVGFMCDDFEGTPQPKEPEQCDGWDWHSVDELPENILIGHRLIIDIFLNPQLPPFRNIDSRGK